MIVHLKQKLGEEKRLLQFANQNVLHVDTATTISLSLHGILFLSEGVFIIEYSRFSRGCLFPRIGMRRSFEGLFTAHHQTELQQVDPVTGRIQDSGCGETRTVGARSVRAL